MDGRRDKNLLLVSSASSRARNVNNGVLRKMLAGRRVIHFDDFSPNPTDEQVSRGAAVCEAMGEGVILSLGGGSSLDLGKLIYAAVKFAGRLWAIPTTFGTGSEVTQFATYYQNGRKKSLDTPDVIPELYVLSDSFTDQIPGTVAAQTVADAFCQATESYWSVRSTVESRAHARSAIQTIWPIIRRGRIQAGDHQDLLRGANLAGQAIQITRTTGPHSLSYPVTSRFGVPHGQAVVLFLPTFVAFNANVTADDCVDRRGFGSVRDAMRDIFEILGVRDGGEAKQLLTETFKQLGLRMSLGTLGIAEKDFKVIMEEGFTPERMGNNPRLVTETDVQGFLMDLR